jgi:hypothetical protein
MAGPRPNLGGAGAMRGLDHGLNGLVSEDFMVVMAA